MNTDKLKALLVIVALVAGSFLLPYKDTTLATTNKITKLVFTTAPQNIQTNTASGVITIQTQDSNDDPEDITGSAETIDLSSSSATGQFSENAVTWVAVTSLTMNKNTSEKSFFYRDSTPGTHTLTITGLGQSWTAGVQNITVSAPDTTAPVITLSGDETVIVEAGSTYDTAEDDGATASDNVDGDITGDIVVGGLPVDTSVLGDHIVTYNVSDAAGNDALEVTRTVTIVDTTAPVITPTGSNPQTILVGQSYVELGANVSDNYDNSVVVDIDDSEIDNANLLNIGSYTVYYNATDSEGNVAVTVTRTVNVVDQEAPVITLLGFNPQTVEVNTSYVEAGATVADNVDSGLSVEIDSSAVITSALGSYSVFYDTEDLSLNHTQVVRTVNVVDTTAPVITLNGNSIVNLIVGDTYTELGASVSDNYDGSTSATVGGDTVDTSTVGTYVVSYDATDTNGNTATQVTRTVNVTLVLDTTAPVITLNGLATVNLTVGDSYSDDGATALDDTDGDVTSSIVVGGDTVDTSTLGTYVITYNVSDSSGNDALEVSRTVNVTDPSSTSTTTPPTTTSDSTSTSTSNATRAQFTRSVAVGQVLGAFIDADTQLRIDALKAQLIPLIQQLIQLLQNEINSQTN